jgi:hypothetical protein
MVFSIEYTHYDGSDTIDSVIGYTNNHTLKYVDLYPNAQKTIMFDDIHSKISYEDYRKHIEALSIQPDCIYAESSFEPLMNSLFCDLEEKGWIHIADDGKDYIRHKDKVYNQDTTFLVRSSSKSQIKFSCPSLVAASYLYKLGYFDCDIVGLDGNTLQCSKTDNILSILPSKYLQVEANARNIIGLLSPNDINRIEYVFY